MKRLLCCLILFLWVNCLQAQDSWTWGGPVDPLQAKYEVEHYTLKLEFFPESQEIKGSNTIKFSCPGKLDTLRLDLINQYQVTKVLVYEDEAEFAHAEDVLDIYIPNGCAEEVTVFYGGKTPQAPNPPWVGGFTWTKDENDNHWMGLSSQNEGAKIFMPAKNHPSSEPREGIDLYLTAPSPYFIASNGRLAQEEEKDRKITYRWTSTYPINNYNINFTLGKFHKESKEYASIDGNPIQMEVYVLEENKAQAPMLLKVLENSTRTHESFFGEFPFPDDKIAVVETPYLGMEHQTINGYGNNFQFVPMGDVQYDWLLHHELGHEWWGNKVSVKDWADFWIHEGFTAYGDWLFFQKHGGDDAYQQKVRSVRKDITNSQPIVKGTNLTAEEAYHPEIYTKGAYILHSLRFMVGDELFFPMLKGLVNDERFIYQNRTSTDEVIEFMETYTEKSLRGFFDLYLFTTDIPKVNLKRKGRGTYQLSLENIDFTMPVEIKTDEGIKTVDLSKKPVTIRSNQAPEVDPRGWYLLEK
ncbi:M1 family metallopeptidase [Litoribacter populi]|uniref:M1 family metallopeptidase n=1 Tax=Litoribacter populi TaxID=2598460 RepID=UPI00117F8557|nr:M1 family metallopeptidase [Litoribacter populi]